MTNKTNSTIAKPDKQTENSQNKTPTLNPIIILLSILLLTTMMSYIIDSGSYQRNGKEVIPNTYTEVTKEISLNNVFVSATDEIAGTARPVSIAEMLMSIPEGLERGSGLIFMVLVIGGLFGIITKTGTIDLGLQRLIALVNGNIYVLTIVLMFVLSCGSTFLGLASEYLILIPILVSLCERIGVSRIIGFAIITISVKAGYLASVTNPLPLTIAQPLLDLQIFSGSLIRFYFFCVFLFIGIAFVLWKIRKNATYSRSDIQLFSEKLPIRHTLIISTIVIGIAILVAASNSLHWGKHQITAYYIFLSIIIAAISGLGASGAADAFVSGMKKVLMASFLIGVATAVAIVLEKGLILDTVVFSLVSIVNESGPEVAALGMFFSQLMLDVLIPSTSGQAAVSMPILGPIGQIAEVPPQTTVMAFLFGNGITNMLTPTSGTLLAYLAIARVSWGEWAKFILPLWAIYIVTAAILLMVSIYIGF